ncbi:CBS domain-containing protein [Rugosimonospora africana]|uniref:Oxidoreductase n=1 Tax=Rugosimonospora africana TaxID=556532 RepID=A0A8J3QUP1_9ACTN|nr:CBS domain-containing protein [Rugosimonospora africana]GIH17820.1 oxidoreductase [Rugosimonospora africana]
MRNMTATSVGEVMTPHPVTVSPDTTIAAAARWMRDTDIGDVIVQDETELYGILTDRDIVVRAVADDRVPALCTVGEVCTTGMTAIGPDAPVELAMELMREHAVRRLPVCVDGRAVGVVTLGDLTIEQDQCSALADICAAEPNL